MSLPLLLNQTVTHVFYIKTKFGSILEPDELPISVILRNGIVDNDVDVVISEDVGGDGWKAQFTIPDTYEIGDVIILRVDATVSGVNVEDSITIGTVYNSTTGRSSSRQTFVDYCLRKLGAPVIKINVDGSQVDDRIEDALNFYYEYHLDSTERDYLIYQITQTDINNKYITLSDNILNVHRILPIESTSTESLFNVEYQIMYQDFLTFRSLDTVNYSMKQQYLKMLGDKLNPLREIRHTRHKHKLSVRTDWNSFKADESIIILECDIKIDPELYTDVYSDNWLRKYSTALIKRQWGENLKKLRGVALIGGVELNGQEIYNESIEEIEKLEQEVYTNYSEPMAFIFG